MRFRVGDVVEIVFVYYTEMFGHLVGMEAVVTAVSVSTDNWQLPGMDKTCRSDLISVARDGKQLGRLWEEAQLRLRKPPSFYLGSQDLLSDEDKREEVVA